ncbi:MAG: MmgE/PrpD family protein [Deltaproteobacteria bacterium]|nr:MmgE/PrpD family protein [Deltaproteobacteria bacterium]
MNWEPQNTVQDLSRKLADFTVSFSLESAPPKVLDNAKIAMLDCLGVAILATSQEIGVALLSFARENASKGSCTVWGTGVTTGSRDAALINGTLAHGLDFDDRNHASTYTLAASIAAAEDSDLPGAKVLESFIVGREIRAGLDVLFARRNSGIGPGARGWHSNGILGPIASACSVSKVLGLNRQQTLTAIGLSAGSCGALTRDGGTMAKPFRVGHAAATGLTCALLAKNGFSSDETPLEGRYGLLEALAPVNEDVLESLGTTLGSEYHLESAIRVKPFASCTATHAGLEAMLRLIQKHPTKSESVESIECDLKPYPLVRRHPSRGFEGRFSMPFCLAITLIYRRLNPDDFINEHVQNPLVQEIMRRTRHIPGSASLVITLKDGTRLVESIQSPTDLKEWNEIRQKFQKCTSGILTARDGEAVLGLVSRLETVPSVRLLTKALRTKMI